MGRSPASATPGREDELEVLVPSGRRLTILGNAAPLFDANGRVRGSVAAFIDISERKEAEDRLVRDNQLLAGIARIFREVLTCETEQELGRVCLEVALDLTDSRLAFIGEVNPGTGMLDGIAVSEAGCQSWSMVQVVGGGASAPLTPTVDGICARVLEDGATQWCNAPTPPGSLAAMPPGHPPLTAFLGVPLKRAGATVGIIGLGNRDGGYDESQQRDMELLAPAIVQAFAWKRSERARREAVMTTERHRTEIEAIYDAAPIGLCVLDRDGRYVRVNRRLAEIDGPPPEAHIGRTIREVVPGVADEAEALLRRVVETGEAMRGVEVRGEVPSQPGAERTWSENWFPVKNADDTVVGVYVAVEEITERKRMEEALRRANQVKDEFLATLSHELRTPLNAILGWSDMLRRGVLDASVSRQAVEAIARNAEAQMHLITDVLDVSRMIAGKLRLEVQDVDLLQVAHLAMSSVRPASDARGVELVLRADGGPAIVSGDPNRLQQVVWNLLSNAVKFTGQGGHVTVDLQRADQQVTLTVSDTGVGIRPEFLPHVFDRFVQADSTTTRRHSGLGLGLSIVRQLVELHGGSVSAASEGEGRGASFTVCLPARGRAQVPAFGAAESADLGVGGLAGVRVLVVDDVEDARLLVSAVVETAGGQAIGAASAAEALAAIARHHPHVIVADIGMPGEDGYEFLRRLREREPAAGGRLPAIAVTAYCSPADREKALRAGFAEHLSKPVVGEPLIAALKRVLGR